MSILQQGYSHRDVVELQSHKNQGAKEKKKKAELQRKKSAYAILCSNIINHILTRYN